MSDTYRANPELWAAAEKWGANTMDMANCILELRARIELLESTQHVHAETSQLSEAKREQIRQELAKPTARQPTFAELLMPLPRPISGSQPPSLKEQALSLVPESGGIPMIRTYSPSELLTIRRALEALPE